MAWFCGRDKFSRPVFFSIFSFLLLPRFGPCGLGGRTLAACCLVLAFWGILICSGTRQIKAAGYFGAAAPAAKPKKIAARGGEQREAFSDDGFALSFDGPAGLSVHFFPVHIAVHTRRGSANSEERKSVPRHPSPLPSSYLTLRIQLRLLSHIRSHCRCPSVDPDWTCSTNRTSTLEQASYRPRTAFLASHRFD